MKIEWVLGFLFLALCSPGSYAETCQFESIPEVIRKDRPGFTQVWTETDRDVLWKEVLPSDALFWNYRRRLFSSIEMSPRKFVRNLGLNERLMLDGELGNIDPVNCLEALLLTVQMRRQDMLDDPTEFVASVFKNKNQLKIVYFTVDQPGIGNITPFQEAMEPYINSSWKHLTNIHNHNFFKSKNGDSFLGGYPVPSKPDVQAMKGLRDNYGLMEVRITNGVFTGRIPADNLDFFEQHVD